MALVGWLAFLFCFALRCFALLRPALSYFSMAVVVLCD
jgi:hypothetical protein